MGTTAATLPLLLLCSLTTLHAQETESSSSLPIRFTTESTGTVFQTLFGSTESRQSTLTFASEATGDVSQPLTVSTEGYTITTPILENATGEYPVARLVDGWSRCAGRVELYNDGTWQPTCTYQWGINEAQTICQMLNCGEAISSPSANCLEYGPCQSYCPSNSGNGLTSSQCEEAATICADAVTTTDCPPGETTTTPLTETVTGEYPFARLVDGWSRCAGSVELYNDGAWQPACTYQWGMSEAQTLCHMLNCGEPISAPSANCLEYGACQSNCPSNNGYGLTYNQCEEAATICADAVTTTDCPPGDTTSTPLMMSVSGTPPYYTTPESASSATPGASIASTATPGASIASMSTPEASTGTPPYYSTPESASTGTPEIPTDTSILTTVVEPTSSAPQDSFCDFLLSQPYGNFSSPSFAGPYPSNAWCRWQIVAKKNFCIKVVISEVNLEPSNGCSYDYVAVYDGLRASAPLLGTVCNDSIKSFTSTSNSMAVLFTSDENISNAGFHAYYHSYRCDTNNAVYFACSSNDMEAVIPTDYLLSLGYLPWDVSLNDPGCDPEITQLFIIFKIPYGGCGTARQLKNSTVTYSNTLRASPSGVVITRQKKLSMDLHCQMYQDAIVEFTYIADDIIEISETEYGHYEVNLSFYQSSYFYQPIIQSPYQVSLNQELYLQATLQSSDPDLQVFIDTCEASPSEDHFTMQTYDIIRNGCVRDSTYQTYESPMDEARFSFRAFDFLRYHPNVYLRCKMVVCSINDNSSRCRQGCLMRRKRSPGRYHRELEVVVGPIQLLE
ncbi:scavenger receptor cysteine-rich domain-containing protein DMBT1-like isoform X3 [Lissotriton helveticus]